MLHIPGLYIADSIGRGRGVFTAHSLIKGDLIEICPLLIVPAKQLSLIHDTILHDYYWLLDKGKSCIALGYGSIYNHNFKPNAKVFIDKEKQEFEVTCITNIKAGEEIFINYEGDDNRVKGEKLWFDVV